MNVIITGGTKGIGRAIAEVFAKEGANLAICARSQSNLSTFEQYFNQQYPNIEVLTKAVDVSKKEEIKGFADFIFNKWQKVDILINNAGLFLMGDVNNATDGLLEQLIDTNLYSAYYLSQAIVPNMMTQKSGHIFNICSVASIKHLQNSGVYCVSKYAMYGFSKSLREEVKDQGIKVTAVLPGGTWSDSWAGVELPQERLMEAKDIAESILACAKLGKSAVVEEIIIRPQLGDL